MKRSLCLIPIFLLFLLVILLANVPTVYAATNNVDISVKLPDGVKVGQPWIGITPEITVVSNETRYTFTVGSNPDDILVASNGQFFIQKNNTYYVTFNLYVEGFKEPIIPANVSFTVNGKQHPVEQIFLQEGERGLYLQFTSCEVSANFSERTTYSIAADGKDYGAGCHLYIYDMPAEVEPGVDVICNAEFYSDSGIAELPYDVETYTVNGLPINSGEKFTMPAEDVVIGAKVVDKYQGRDYISAVDITLDFDDPELFYGKRVPTVEEFAEALTVSYNIQGLPVEYRFHEVAHFEEGPAWGGNIMLSFQLEVPEGYLFANPYLREFDMDENGNETLPLKDWLDENFEVKINGVETFYRLDPVENYAQGYFISGYFASPETLEIHIFWYTTKEITNIDLSNYQAGDTVVITDLDWQWDGYMPYAYQLRYINEYGEEWVSEFLGNSFVMPKAQGDIKLYVDLVRGSYPAEDTPDLGTPDIIPIQIQKLKDDDCGGIYYQVCDLAGTVLNGQKITFNKLDTSNGVFLEVVFPVDDDFDADFIAFYRLTGEFYGFWEIVPALVDPQTGLCHAIMSHDGPPYIEHTYENGDDTVCSVCGYGQVEDDDSDAGDDTQNGVSNGGNTISNRGYLAKLLDLFINWIRSIIEKLFFRR